MAELAQALGPLVARISVRDPGVAEHVFRAPICVLEGVALDTRSFSSSYLAAHHGTTRVEIRRQTTAKEARWHCTSKTTEATLGQYLVYQAQAQAGTTVDFCTNVDLERGKWGSQVAALASLPVWLRPNEPLRDLLAYASGLIPGMNQAQLYVKVAGCRTPAHHENLDFCAVNYNVGPGNCTWWAVDTGRDAAAAARIGAFCGAYGHDYARGSWWPDADELRRSGIAVTQFEQGPGETVCVGIGALHWVRADGPTINVAWNIGPATARQFTAAAHRYNINRAHRVKSIVPMQALAWRLLAADVVKADEALLASVRNFCQHSLEEERCFAELCAVRHFAVREGMISDQFCEACDGELFNHVFEIKGKPYCGRCVRKQHGIRATRQRPLEQLERLLAAVS